MHACMRLGLPSSVSLLYPNLLDLGKLVFNFYILDIVLYAPSFFTETDLASRLKIFFIKLKALHFKN